MPEHRVATQEEWQAERDKLLAEEKKLTHRGDELTKMRQELPWVAGREGLQLRDRATGPNRSPISSTGARS